MSIVIDLGCPSVQLLIGKHQTRNKDRYQTGTSKVLDFHTWKEILVFRVTPPVLYTRLADPWEKATRMICGEKHVDEYF